MLKMTDVVQATEKEVHDEHTVENGDTVTSPTASSLTSTDGDREIKALKTILAQQSRQISALTKTVGELVEQMKTLKSS
jgi:hypothetical protein